MNDIQREGIEDFVHLAFVHKKQLDMYIRSLPDEWATRGACYTLEQVIEDELKALVYLSNEYPAEKHNLPRFINQLENKGIKFSDTTVVSAALATQWESITRYGRSFNYSEREFRTVVNAEKEVFNVLEGKLKEMGLEALLTNNDIVGSSEIDKESDPDPTDDSDNIDP